MSSRRRWTAIALVAAATAGCSSGSASPPTSATMLKGSSPADVTAAVRAHGGHLCFTPTPTTATSALFALADGSSCTPASESGQGLLEVNEYQAPGQASAYLDAVKREYSSGGASTAREVGWQVDDTAVVLLGSPSRASTAAVAAALAGRATVVFGTP